MQHNPPDIVGVALLAATVVLPKVLKQLFSELFGAFDCVIVNGAALAQQPLTKMLHRTSCTREPIPKLEHLFGRVHPLQLVWKAANDSAVRNKRRLEKISHSLEDAGIKVRLKRAKKPRRPEQISGGWWENDWDDLTLG